MFSMQRCQAFLGFVVVVLDGSCVKMTRRLCVDEIDQSNLIKLGAMPTNAVLYFLFSVSGCEFAANQL